jgi:hypothetical protein
MGGRDVFRILGSLLALVGAVLILIPLLRAHLNENAPAELDVRVCRGEHEARCPRHKFFVGCGSITEWTQKRCLEFRIVDVSYVEGGRCGYVIANVTCKVGSTSPR